MNPCKHLNYEADFTNCKIMNCGPGNPEVRFWRRLKTPYEGAAVNVQFCKKRGRVPSIFDCYDGGFSCYEPENTGEMK